MKKLRIYVDASVVGGCFDIEFAEWSNRLLRAFRTGEFLAVLSAVTAAEIEQAPDPVRRIYEELVSMGAEVLLVSREAIDLSVAYERRKILGPRFRNDMLHLAVATVAEVDVLVSWNFRHIVRLDRIRQFNSVNMELGYKQLAIYSPREVIPHETDD